MLIRMLIVFALTFLLPSCTMTNSLVAERARISLTTDHFSVNYSVDQNDRVLESVRYDPNPLDFEDITLSERSYVAKGAYERLAVLGWAEALRAAPQKAKAYSGSEYHAASRQSIPLPTLSVWYSEGAISSGELISINIPIPTHQKPGNGQTQNWASERAWMGQMVGQFLDVVGPPKLNAEDYVNRIPEDRRNQLPLKLNFSDYR